MKPHQISGKFQICLGKGQGIIQISQGNLKKIFEVIDQENDDKRKIVYEFLKAISEGE